MLLLLLNIAAGDEPNGTPNTAPQRHRSVYSWNLCVPVTENNCWGNCQLSWNRSEEASFDRGCSLEFAVFNSSSGGVDEQWKSQHKNVKSLCMHLKRSRNVKSKYCGIIGSASPSMRIPCSRQSSEGARRWSKRWHLSAWWRPWLGLHQRLRRSDGLI